VKRVAFHTLGCKLNQADTETMRALLSRTGEWTCVSEGEDADLVVVNTCTVTNQADARSRQAIRRLRGSHPDAVIAAAGCYVQRAPGEVAALPGVRLLVGAADRERLPELAARAMEGIVRLDVAPIDEARTFVDVATAAPRDHTRAFVDVQEGCDEACSFCIVPKTRGASRSRPFASVVRQAESLAAEGVRELVLTGVHLGDYGLDFAGRRLLVELLQALVEVPGLLRVRLSSIEPASVSAPLVDLLASERRLARHVHLPLQSGSASVLRAMGRRYAPEDFAALVREIERRVPHCGIGTDVIAGFPDENEDAFQETFDLLLGLPITYLHAFSYSVRPGSAAESRGDPVPGDVKRRRVAALRTLSAAKSRGFRERLEGEIVRVLLEDVRRDGARALAGRTDHYVHVDVPAPFARAGGAPWVDVRITGLSADGCLGELVGAEREIAA
jgi:threonylcarbamoyladenosine tRNA methylthiotransferase MtaB